MRLAVRSDILFALFYTQSQLVEVKLYKSKLNKKKISKSTWRFSEKKSYCN